MSEVLFTVSVAYFLKRLGVFSEEHSRVLVNYVLYFALPALSFKTAYGLGLSWDVAMVTTGAWAIITLSLALAYIAGKLIKLEQSNLRTLMMISAFGNTAFLGYPYSFAYFGEHGLKYAVIYDSMGSFLAVSSVGLLILKGGLDMRSLILFPPFLGLVFGFFLKGYQLPAFLWSFIDFVVSSLLPVVLFSLGLSLKFSHIARDRKLLVLALCIKMLAAPLIALLVLKLIPMNPTAYKVSVLESAMPAMITASVLVLKYGLNHNLAFAGAGIGMVISFFSIPLWVRILENL
ncbi:MAG: AEC family transporter [Aquificaceae bacterium]|nr:AEC family transporter [Aquificaceae bacterium]